MDGMDETTKLREEAWAALAQPNRFDLPSLEGLRVADAGALALYGAIEARLRELAQDSISRQVVVTAWGDGYSRPIERTIYNTSTMMVLHIPTLLLSLRESGYRATHITIDTLEPRS